MDGSAKVEAEPRLDGRNMVMVLAPDKRAKQAAASRQRSEAPAEADGVAETNGTGPTSVATTNGSAVAAPSAPVEPAEEG